MQENNDQAMDYLLSEDKELTNAQLREKYSKIHFPAKATKAQMLEIISDPEKAAQAETDAAVKEAVRVERAAQAQKEKAKEAATLKEEADKEAAAQAQKEKLIQAEKAAIKAAQSEGLSVIINGDTVKKDNDFIPKQNERHMYHVELDKQLFSVTTGKKLQKAFIQAFSKSDYSNFAKNGAGTGFTARVLWNPAKYRK